MGICVDPPNCKSYNNIIYLMLIVIVFYIIYIRCILYCFCTRYVCIAVYNITINS